MEVSYENLVLGTLSSDAFVMVNKKLAQKLGFLEAGLLGELIATHRMCKANNSFFKDQWFYITQPYIEKHLGIKRSGFETAVKNLKKEKVIQQKRMDLPAKNHYLINWTVIVELMSENDENDEKSPLNSDCRNPANKNAEILQTRMQESCKQDCGNPATIKSTYKNKYIKTNSNIKSLLTSEEIIDYCNSLYTKYSSGRWSKRQWNALINKFIQETDWDLVVNSKAYIIESIETIAYRHDLKNGKIHSDSVNWLKS